MTYYITLPGDPAEALMYDDCILGEISSNGKTFYPNRGFQKFLKIVNKAPALLENIQIHDDTNKLLTTEQFLNELGKCQIQKYTGE